MKKVGATYEPPVWHVAKFSEHTINIAARSIKRKTGRDTRTSAKMPDTFQLLFSK